MENEYIKGYTVKRINGRDIVANKFIRETPTSRLLVTYEGVPMICRREKGNNLRAENGLLIYAPFATVHGVIDEYYKI